MFDWLFKRAEKEESLLEIITSTTQQLQLYEFAKEKAIGMIADAIAKSEIVVQRKDKKGTRRAKDDVYWRLNVRLACGDPQTADEKRSVNLQSG